MPLFWEKIGVAGRMSWIAMLFVLLGAEYRAIDKDHTDTVAAEESRRSTENAQFQNIATGITSAIQQSQQQFAATMARSNAILGGIAESLRIQTGGDSFCYLDLSPSSLNGIIQLTLIQYGRNHVFNVNIRVVDIEKLFGPGSESSFSIPFLARGTALMLSTFPLGPGDYKRYNIFLMAPNGAFTESVRLNKVVGTNAWERAIWVTASYYDGKRGIVLEDTKNFPSNLLQSDSDWKGIVSRRLKCNRREYRRAI